MFTLKNPLLLLLLSSGAESKLGETGKDWAKTEILIGSHQDQADPWFDWSTFTPEERYIVESDATLGEQMADPNHVGHFASDINTNGVNWDVVVVNDASELKEIENDHTIVEKDHIRIPVSVKAEDISKEEERRLAEDIPWGINNIFDNVLPDLDAIFGTDRSNDAIKVCIIDSGYNEAHNDLPEGADATGGLGGSWNQDQCEHGSHVAGTMLAKKNNDIGVVGVFPGQEPLIVKVFSGSGCGYTWSSAFILAMQKCQSAGAKVINMSLGGGSFSNSEQAAINTMYDEGMLLVAAAGNGGNDSYLYPASYDNVVSVAAIDSNNQKAGFSQYNDQVDIAAPGVGIDSTKGVGQGIHSYSGTSMASPHVAGLASLLWNQFPTCTNTQIIEAMEQGAKEAGDPGYDHKFGHGIAKYYPTRDILAAGCGRTEPTVSPAPTKAPTTATPTTSPAPTVRKHTFELKVKTDNYPSETSWTLKLGETTIANGGSYTTPNADQDPVTVEIPVGDYELKFMDMFGDGMCCEYGQGSYEATVEGEVVASGGQFGQEKIHNFSVVDTPGTPTTTQPSPTTTQPSPTTTQPSPTLPPTVPTLPPTVPTLPPTVLPTEFPSAQTSGISTDISTGQATGISSTPPTSAPTSAPTPAPTPAPSLNPTSTPSSSPVVVKPILEQCLDETQGDTTDFKYWAACGRKNRCNNEENGDFSYEVLHEVRCCSDDEIEGWKKYNNCPYTQSNLLGECYGDQNFFMAECICGKYNGRLCTREEIEGNCARSTGCGFDNDIVWTQTRSIDEQCTDDVVGKDTPFKHYAICGREGRCPNEAEEAYEFETLHEVRCCSVTQKTGWTKRGNCDVWTNSKMDGVCYENKNWFEATCICEKHDARLCNKEEVEGNCTRGTGCGFDNDLTWTSTQEEESSMVN